jgi:hypothetical protein
MIQARLQIVQACSGRGLKASIPVVSSLNRISPKLRLPSLKKFHAGLSFFRNGMPSFSLARCNKLPTVPGRISSLVAISV